MEVKCMNIIRKIYRKIKPITAEAFKSANYWENRYRSGGNSGAGSYGEMAEFKAKTVNGFVTKHEINSVIDFGCGDGNQLTYAEYPSYTGLDVSHKAIEICIDKFKDDPQKAFFWYSAEHFLDNLGVFKADLALSMEVIFHLVEDDVYFKYIKQLFNASQKYVIIHSTNFILDNPTDANGNKVTHVRHREFVKDVEHILPEFKLIKSLPSPIKGKEQIKFFFFEKIVN